MILRSLISVNVCPSLEKLKKGMKEEHKVASSAARDGILVYQIKRRRPTSSVNRIVYCVVLSVSCAVRLTLVSLLSGRTKQHYLAPYLSVSMSGSGSQPPNEIGTLPGRVTRKRRKVTRTRAGCLTCRQRRKACDMVKPECGACLRLKKVSICNDFITSVKLTTQGMLLA